MRGKQINTVAFAAFLAFFMLVGSVGYALGVHHDRRPLVQCYIEAYGGDLVAKGCERIP